LIEPLTVPTSAEHEFTRRLQEGELLPEILFPDDARTADRIRLHPALLWKAENARAHRTMRPREETEATQEGDGGSGL
jgi:hypothetical protein